MKAVIVEDEERSKIVLENLLETYCPEVQIAETADSVTTAVKAIRSHEPDIVFLDVQINGGTGFDVLDKLDAFGGAVIFTTAYDQYALKAFKFSAIDYLLKPIDIEELKNAVKKASAANEHSIHPFKIRNLLSNLRNPEERPVLLVSTFDTVEFVRIEDIIRCEAQGAYTQLHLKDSKPVLISKVIKELEFLLSEYGFFRVHQSHLINMKEIRRFIRSENSLLMRDGAQIQVARSRKDDFFKAMNKVQI